MARAAGMMFAVAVIAMTEPESPLMKNAVENQKRTAVPLGTDWTKVHCELQQMNFRTECIID
jgi:hypothetical protein